MNLDGHKKQLLFDYCMGITSQDESLQARELISSDPGAAEIYSKLKSVFSPLDKLESEPCPDGLLEQTLLRLNEASNSGHIHLQQLLKQQSKDTVTTSRFWRNFSQMAATAAAVVLIAGVLFTSLHSVRQNYWQGNCSKQLAQFYSGLSNYRNDNDGLMPLAASAGEAAWWKYSGDKSVSHSNTRNLWMLAKQDYVDHDTFVCPAKRQGCAIQIDESSARKFDDFPDRRYITYSYRVICNKASGEQRPSVTVLLSDQNPLFERLPIGRGGKLNLKIDDLLSRVNSSNHSGRGQNVLFCDGAVRFKKTRRIGISKDDIFTLKNTKVYRGTEMPVCTTDAFLAP